MCGICGFAGIHEDGLLEAMTRTLEHRGPDSAGYFRENGVGLGHRRLSIIDVDGGQQPIENEDGSLVLIANGEIYNYRELREQLLARGHRFRTHSDSEVLLHLYEDHGPDLMRRILGMYAFAIYDRRRGHLFLGRDRLGIKPLYYAELSGGRLLFASEMKALLRYGGLDTTLVPQAVHDYLALRYVPGPGGMFAEIQKLPAGHWGLYRDGRLRLEPYWAPTLHETSDTRSEPELLEELEQRFQTSIDRRLISDVPLGAYLSGGLDSSIIVAAMARGSSRPIKTFSVGFDYEHDELEAAAATAKLLGCDHTEIPCTADDIELLPKLVWHLDEPLGDPIVIPMYQLARVAKQSVTVVLSGEGADEVFGGYLFHKALLFAHRFARVAPGPVRNGLVRPALSALPSGLLNLAFSYPADLGRRGKQKLVDFLGYLAPQQLPAAYRHLISLFDDRDLVDLYTPDFRASLGADSTWPEWEEAAHSRAPFLNRILHLQFAHWLADDILTKQDKTSMASAVEARVPFLDHELVEFGLGLPPRQKIRGLTSKYLLRRLGERMLPPEVIKRPKMPFYIPLERYAGHPAFQAMIDDALSDERLKQRGIFRPEAVRALRERFRTGEFMYVKQVFALVVLELWLQMAVDTRATLGTPAHVGS
ncbi:MAG: asparagine synthase (glutamine-hydrolyzing) [Gemmatimonadota bacterium]